MSELSRLAALCSKQELGLDYAACGFHARHVSSAPRLPEVAEVFRAAGYLLENLTCLDLRQVEQRMRVVYVFNPFAAVDRHVVHVDLAPVRAWSGPAPKAAKGQTAASDEATAGEVTEAPLPSSLPSIVGLYPSADWFEREAYDMFGVHFAGHPELRRILLPEDADFHALLKDFGRMEDAAP